MQTTNRWQVGNATVTRVVECEAGAFSPGHQSHRGTRAVNQWPNPHYATADGNIRL